MEFDNPFKQLDKKSFPDSKSPSHKHSKAKQNVKPLAKQKKIENSNDDWLNPDLDSENELFLRSMTQNTRVFKKEEIEEPTKDNSHKKSSKEEVEEEKFNFSANSLTIPNDIKNQFKSSSDIEEKYEAIQTSTDKHKVKDDIKEMDFFTAMQDVTPLAGKERIAAPEPEQIIHQNDRSHMIYDFEEGKLEFALTYTEEHVQCNIMGLDIQILAQLQQRHYNPEAHFDLHGLNVYQAYHSLLGFLKNAYYRDMRCVLLVTGKGLNSYDRVAVLRSKVANWLIDSPFKHFVLAFCSAQPQDGGTGALYILLRKRKKNAKAINWEQMPTDYDLWADLDK